MQRSSEKNALYKIVEGSLVFVKNQLNPFNR